MGDTVPLTEEQIAQLTGNPDPATKDFIFQGTMYRVKDPKRSLEFYAKVLGMILLKKWDFPSMKFSVYFLGYESKDDIPTNEDDRTVWTMTRRGTLELTHNWGTETNADFAYNAGNKDNSGYGKIGICVPDVAAACQRFEQLGVEFIKKEHEGKMRGLAIIKDPDGYSIEIFHPRTVP